MIKTNSKPISRNPMFRFLAIFSGMFLFLALASFLADGCTRNIAVSPSHLPYTPTPTVTQTPTNTSTPSVTPTATSTPTATPFVLFEDFENAATGPWASQDQFTTTYWWYYVNCEWGTGPCAGNATTVLYNYDGINYSPIDVPPGWSMGLTLVYTRNSDWIYTQVWSQYGTGPAGPISCLINGTTPPGHLNFWAMATNLTQIDIGLMDNTTPTAVNSWNTNNTWILPGAWTQVSLPLTNPTFDSNITSIDFSNFSNIELYFVGPASGAFPITQYVNVDDFYFTP